MIDLSSERSIRTSLFIRIQVDEYRTSPSAAYIQEVLAFSDHFEDYTLDGEVYQNINNLLGVTDSRSELRPSSASVNITISGIPNSAIAEILHSKIKGSPVSIFRGYFDIATGNQIGDIQGRFRGFVNNYALEEQFDVDARTATNTIDIECASTIDVLQNKQAGRKTNPQSHKQFYPNDESMKRVPNLENSTFNFGAPE